MDHYTPVNFTIIQPSPLSDWKCEISSPNGLVFRPVRGAEPNAFHRLMQRLCFGFKWVRA
jgi:hypothetical protein